LKKERKKERFNYPVERICPCYMADHLFDPHMAGQKSWQEILVGIFVHLPKNAIVE